MAKIGKKNISQFKKLKKKFKIYKKHSVTGYTLPL